MKKFSIVLMLSFLAFTASNASVFASTECIYRIVATEMSSSFNVEALKAQAVAARTYSLYRRGIHTADRYDICDVRACTHNTANIHERVKNAVDETRGQVMMYDGRLINATYFASSGGVTDDSENVWVDALPYLRSVTDPVEHEPPIWTRSFTLNDLSRLLNTNNANIGQATGVSITRTSSNGRVQELTIHGAGGDLALTKERIRTFFSSSEGGSLESRNFVMIDGLIEMEPDLITVMDRYNTYTLPVTEYYAMTQNGSLVLLDNLVVFDGRTMQTYSEHQVVTSTGEGVTFNGRGWGHGAGLSQRGAEGFARLGYDYMTILKHFYSGIDIIWFEFS